jgi:hypothetical protein
VAGRDIGPDGPRARDLRPRNRRRGPRPGRGFGFAAQELSRCGAAQGSVWTTRTAPRARGAQASCTTRSSVLPPRPCSRRARGARRAAERGRAGIGCGDFAHCRSCQERYNSTGGLRLPPPGERPRTANETLTRFLEMVRGITREVRPRAPARPGGGRRLTGRGRWRRSKRRGTSRRSRRR